MKAYCGPSFLTTTLTVLYIGLIQRFPAHQITSIFYCRRNMNPLLTGPVEVNNSVGMKKIHRIKNIHHHLQDHDRIKQHPTLELRLQGVSWENPKPNIKQNTLLTIPTIPHEYEERERDTVFLSKYCGMIPSANHLIKLILKVNYMYSDMIITENNIAIKFTYFRNKMDNFDSSRKKPSSKIFIL